MQIWFIYESGSTRFSVDIFNLVNSRVRIFFATLFCYTIVYYEKKNTYLRCEPFLLIRDKFVNVVNKFYVFIFGFVASKKNLKLNKCSVVPIKVRGNQIAINYFVEEKFFFVRCPYNKT